MNTPTLAPIRNFGIIFNIDSGKTTVSERILHYTGETRKALFRLASDLPGNRGWNKSRSRQ